MAMEGVKGLTVSEACICCLSHYRLLVTEAHSQVFPCADMDIIDRMLPLIHLPVKDSGDFYSLGDIVANGQKLDGTLINILAAVRLVGNIHAAVSKFDKGSKLSCSLCASQAFAYQSRGFHLDVCCVCVLLHLRHLSELSLAVFSVSPNAFRMQG